MFWGASAQSVWAAGVSPEVADTENRCISIDKDLIRRCADGLGRGARTQVNERTAWALLCTVQEYHLGPRPQEKMQERTAWAQKLDGELKRLEWPAARSSAAPPATLCAPSATPRNDRSII